MLPQEIPAFELLIKKMKRSGFNTSKLEIKFENMKKECKRMYGNNFEGDGVGLNREGWDG